MKPLLDPALLQSIREAIWRLSKKEQAAIWRSLESYKQALATLDAMVEFLILWVTVETLNRALGIRGGIEAPKKLEGTRAFFERRGTEGKELYRSANKLRNDWIHGSTAMAGMGDRARGLVLQMRLVARDAIFAALDIKWTGDATPLKHWPVHFVAHATLHATPGRLPGVEEDLPSLGLLLNPGSKFSRVGNQIKSAHSIRMNPRLAPGISCDKIHGLQFVGEQVTGLEVPADAPSGDASSRRAA